eukprot:693468-Amphidinium_carterae.1
MHAQLVTTYVGTAADITGMVAHAVAKRLLLAKVEPPCAREQHVVLLVSSMPQNRWTSERWQRANVFAVAIT